MNILYTNGDIRCNEIKRLLMQNNIPFVESKDYKRLMQYDLYNLPYVEYDYREDCGCGVILGYTEIKERYTH